MEQKKIQIQDFLCSNSEKEIPAETDWFVPVSYGHVLEAEAFGGIIEYRGAGDTPRAAGFRYHNIEELLKLPEMDFTKGHMREMFENCQKIHDKGRKVLSKISGPLTILDGLIEAGKVYKALRKKRELMKPVLDHIRKQLEVFIQLLSAQGVELISYADPAGSVKILGPETAAWMVENFTYPLLKQTELHMGSDTTMVLCPKTVLALQGVGKIEHRKVKLETEEPIYYAKACAQMAGKIRFVGQGCINQDTYYLTEGFIQEIVLK